MAGIKTAVFGIYSTVSAAEHAVDALGRAGFPITDVSILVPESIGSRDIGTEKKTKAPEGAAAGAGTGALFGGTLGLLVGVGVLAVPGVDRGADGILHSKVKLGADASVAAGPKGREATAETDAALRAEMLSYSRSRGAFAGVSLEGSTIRPDEGANKRLYGKDVSAVEIVEDAKVAAPESARDLIARLQEASPHLKA